MRRLDGLMPRLDGLMPRLDHWNHNTHYYPLVLAAAPSLCRRALDVGCGEGLLVRALAARCSAVTALDRSPEMISLTRETCAGLPNVAYVTGDLLQTELSGSFDLVASVAVIHHLDFAAALGRMASLLRPGGRLIVIGLARNASPVDLAFAAAGVPVHRVLSARHGYWKHRAPVADPAMSWGEVRAAARRLLPSVRWRRLMLWRYALTWTKPGLP